MKQEITILAKRRNGKGTIERRVMAVVRGEFAIHRASFPKGSTYTGWALTHVPTGAALVTCSQRLDTIRRALAEFRTLPVDWHALRRISDLPAPTRRIARHIHERYTTGPVATTLPL